jgi:broad specificity phosphatase PhoE
MVLTRHGATPRSDPEQHLGQGIDIGLSDEGRAAARALAARLQGVTLGRIVASPLRRAQETAELLAGARPIESDARIAEMDYGEWEGLTYEQIDARDPELRERWVADPATLACPGGESGEDVARRAASFVEDAVRWAGDAAGPGERQRMLVVAHATFNRILLSVVLGVPLRDYRRRFRQDPANLTILSFGSEVGDKAIGAKLVVGNDTSHVSRNPRDLGGGDG